MMPAAKHGDPQIGVDIHLCVVPPSPSPVPLPTPHMSIVFDPMDYIPIIGATVTVCGMKRATAGTSGKAVHIPPGFPFAPKIPDTSDEIFMGSATVVADGDPFSFLSVPVLSCQVAGMMSPPRLKKKDKKLMLLPTVTNLAIPTNVFIGGPPTISLMGMAFKLGFAALGKFAKSKLFKRMRQKAFGGMKSSFLKCKILRAEPVDILTGEVSVEQLDFTLPGRIPIEWVRSYRSNSARRGACGYGWETPADIRLEVFPQDNSVAFLRPAAAPALFPEMPAAGGDDGAVLELWDGALLGDFGSEFRVRTKEDRIYHFDKAGRCASKDGVQEYPIKRISDLCGNWLEFERRGPDVTVIKEAAGRRIEVETEHGLIRQLQLFVPSVDLRHMFVQYEYDGADNLVAVVDALGNPYTFAYDDHRLIRHTDRNRLSFYYEYGKQNDTWRVVHAWGDGGLYDYRFEYLDELKERRITDSLGHVSLVKLDESDLPISEIDPLGGVTIYEYDDVGRTTAVVDQDRHRTEYEYDERGNLLRLTRPDGVPISMAFDAADNLVALVDACGQTWRQRWNERHRMIERQSPLGNVWRFEYDTHGQLTAVTDPLDHVTHLAYDATGELTHVLDSLGGRTEYVYDARGNLVARSDAGQRRTIFGFDAKNRLTRAQFADGSTVKRGYDAEDNLTHFVDERGAEIRIDYAGTGEVRRRTWPDGTFVEYFYDTEERLVGVRNERGELLELVLDPLGRVVEEIDYWKQSRRYEYALCGHPRAVVDPLRRRTTIETDVLGRMTARRFPDGSQEVLAYDPDGRILSGSSSAGTFERRYDVDGRLVEERQDALTVRNEYDACGNRVRRDTSLGNVSTFTFDALADVVAVDVNEQRVLDVLRRETTVLDERLAPNIRRHQRFDHRGMPLARTTFAGSRQLFETRYEYDASGNMTRRLDSEHGADSYAYDERGFVQRHHRPQEGPEHFTRDAVGDRLVALSEVETHSDSAGELSREWVRQGTFRQERCRFDRAGDLVARSHGSVDVEMQWGVDGRLHRSVSGGVATRYGYDAVGRRVFKETGDERIQFLWDGDTMVGELRPRNRGASREYLYYPDTFEPLAMVAKTAEARAVLHFHNDPNGSPVRLTNTKGEVKWAASYGAFGAVAKTHYDAVENPLRLQGQYYDAETGLHYNRYRYYVPSLGMFATQDPLRLGAGDHLYWYAPNVSKWTDPLGLTCRIQGIHSDTFTKGVHINASNGVELMVRPGHSGSIVFVQVFSKDGPAAVREAIREATEDLSDPRWVGKLKATADHATKYLASNGAPAKSAETRFLSKAIDKLGE